EDVALVRCLVARGKQVEMFDGRDLLVVEMFESFGDTWRGWGRSLALSAVESRWRQVTGVLVTALTLVAPLLLVAVGGVTQSLFFTPFSATLLAIDCFNEKPSGCHSLRERPREYCPLFEFIPVEK
ncbi:MAG: hypothetical protein EBT80_09740, partial [Chitinophagales bacterium]|nr:hypothetical protein [Chitinophagales bacterium]